MPADPLRRREWARSAGRIEQHRAVYDITDLHHALGMEPAWNDASHRAIEHFRLVRTVAADRTPSFSRGVEPLQGPVLEL